MDYKVGDRVVISRNRYFTQYRGRSGTIVSTRERFDNGTPLLRVQIDGYKGHYGPTDGHGFMPNELEPARPRPVTTERAW